MAQVALETPAGAQAKVDAHAGGADPHTGYVQPADLATVAKALPQRHTDWTSRATGAMGTTGDEGVTINAVLSGTVISPSVANGRLECDLTTDPGAVYVQQDLGRKVRRIGAVFGFGPGGNGSAVGLIAWATGGPAGTVSDTHVHFIIGPASWSYDVWQGNVMTTLIGENFATPLPKDYSEQRAEVSILGNTAHLVLPDGSSRSVTDSRIGSINGVTACWEYYQPVSTQSPMVFYQTWADGKPTPTGSSSDVQAALIARRPAVAATQRAASPDVSLTIPTSSTQIADTLVTQVAGPTGKVLVDIEAWITITTAAAYVWEVSVDGAYGIGIVVMSGLRDGFYSKKFLLSGYVPGSKHDFRMNHWGGTGIVGHIRISTGEGKYLIVTATPV